MRCTVLCPVICFQKHGSRWGPLGCIIIAKSLMIHWLPPPPPMMPTFWPQIIHPVKISLQFFFFHFKGCPILLAMLQMTLKNHYYGPKFEMKFWFVLAITFCLADTTKPDFPTNILLKSYQKRQKYFVTFPNNLILVRSYTQKVMANNKCGGSCLVFPQL